MNQVTRSPRMTTRRWMLAVAVMAVQLWGGIALYRWCMPPERFDPFDAVEMVGASSDDR
jgi:hypothetical protein